MKYLFLLSMIIFCNICIAQVDTSIKVGYVWAQISDSSNQSIIFPTGESSNIAIGFTQHNYTEPVSMLPLAIIMVLGLILIIGLPIAFFQTLSEHIKNKRNKSTT